MIIIAFLFATGLLLSLLLNGYIQSRLNDSNPYDGNHEIRIFRIYIDKTLHFEIEIREVESNKLLYGNTLTSEETAAFLNEFDIPVHFDYIIGAEALEVVRSEYPSKYTQEYVDYIDMLRNSSIYE
jgi:hypothetical protein